MEEYTDFPEKVLPEAEEKRLQGIIDRMRVENPVLWNLTPPNSSRENRLV